jgi:Fe-S-cluster containining protein
MPHVTSLPAHFKQAFDAERAATKALYAQPRDAATARQATVRMYGRLAELQARTMSAQQLVPDCAAGCHHCCHLRVEARPHEIFLLAHHISTQVDDTTRRRMMEKLAQTVARVAPLSADEHIRAGIPCALLEDGRCSVYAARPAACRKYYSMSVDTCRDAHADPHAPLSRDIENETLRLAGNAIALGHAQGIDDAQLNASLVELQQALLKALTTNKPEKRWRDGKKPFV